MAGGSYRRGCSTIPPVGIFPLRPMSRSTASLSVI
jgi:hypothetical protein